MIFITVILVNVLIVIYPVVVFEMDNAEQVLDLVVFFDFFFSFLGG